MNAIKILAFIAATVILSSCNEGVWGTGPVETISYDISNINAISLNGTGKVHLKQGIEEKVIVTTNENLQDIVEIKIVDHTLVMGVRPGFSIIGYD